MEREARLGAREGLRVLWEGGLAGREAAEGRAVGKVGVVEARVKEEAGEEEEVECGEVVAEEVALEGNLARADCLEVSEVERGGETVVALVDSTAGESWAGPGS